MCTCWGTHHLLYILAGASFGEAFMSLIFHFSGVLPLTFWGMTLTKDGNLILLGGALLLGFVFLYMAGKSNGHHSGCSDC